ncbi:hypothetical protein ACH34F_12920 [Elizabethkingia anophelis]
MAIYKENDEPKREKEKISSSFDLELLNVFDKNRLPVTYAS